MRKFGKTVRSFIVSALAFGSATSAFAAVMNEANIQIAPLQNALSQSELDGLSDEQQQFLVDLMARLEASQGAEKAEIVKALWFDGHWSSRYLLRVSNCEPTRKCC